MSENPNMIKKKGIFSFYFNTNLLYRILTALVLGAILGYFFQGHNQVMEYLQPLGDIFIKLLKMIIMPVIVFTLVVGASSIPPSHLAKFGIKIIIFYMVTSIFAIVVGLLVGGIFAPGKGLEIAADVQSVTKVASSPSIVDIIVGLIPSNPFESLAKGQVLPVIVFSLFFGIALAFCRDSSDKRIKDNAELVFNFFEALCQIIFKIVRWVMELSPIGVFALIFIVFSKNAGVAFSYLGGVTLSVYVALIIQLVVVYGLITILFRINPVKFFSGIKLPFITAFVTRSSSATLPVTMNAAENNLGVPRSISGFGLPIGATINMDGSTIYLGVCAMFIANAAGISLDFTAQLTIVLTAVLASIGTAGVPGAGAIMLLMVLESVGLKVEAGTVVALIYAIILGIDALLDMGRTAVNISGDLLGVTVISKTEGQLDESKWK